MTYYSRLYSTMNLTSILWGLQNKSNERKIGTCQNTRNQKVWYSDIKKRIFQYLYFNLLHYIKWLIFGNRLMRSRVRENTEEVIYDDTEAVRGSWLCTYWLLQVSEFICYASSVAGLLPKGHATEIQRAASTSGACKRGNSDRFVEGNQWRRNESKDK